MFRNYFKTAWRNLKNSKVYSGINILGLAGGMAVALIIGLWVYHEYSYDRFLPEYEKVYRVKRNFDSNGDTLTFNTTSLRLAEALRTEIPEIEYVAESDWMGQHGLMVGEKKVYLYGGQSAVDFLKVFQYPLVKGNVNSVFSDPYSIVITESTAKALFGNEDPINKMIRYDNKDDLKVTGILKDIPSNSTLQFNFIVPITYVEAKNPRVKANRTGSFGNNGYQIFVKLKPGVTYEQASKKVRLITHSETNNTNAMKSFVILQALKDHHLYNEYENGQVKGGFIEYVRMFSIIGVLVLLIACINFINLTTARSEKRAKEVGVRKAIGSMRKHLVYQFLAESFLLTFISFLFSLLFVQLALPAFNALTGSEIRLPFGNVYFWLIMLGSILVTAIIAGSRPAFYLSAFKPVKVLKGTFKMGKNASLPRKILVVTQFSCSVALIISTIIVYQQIQHARNRPTGYDVDRLIGSNMNEDLKKNYIALRDELVREGIVESVTTATSPATDLYWHTDLDNWPGKNAGETVEMACVITSEDYFKTLGMKIVQGRDFAGLNDTLSVIFNEAAIARLRIKDPVSQVVQWGGQQFKIAGVVKDALMLSPFESADPSMFFIDGTSQKGRLMYRLAKNIPTETAVTRLTTIFNKYSPAYPYNYSFSDSDYAEKFKLEVLIGKLAGIFAALAILISCLGLFGLATYIAEQRTKEIGIRKVLGASVPQLWALLSKDFVVLVLISCIVASPLAYYFLHDWLQKYPYRINIGVSVFVLAAVMALVITIVTISYQAIKAAIANPVRSLRSE